MLLQLVENRLITEFEDEVQFPLPPEHLNEVDQVGMLQVLQHPNLSHCDFLDQRIIFGFLQVQEENDDCYSFLL